MIALRRHLPTVGAPAKAFLQTLRGMLPARRTGHASPFVVPDAQAYATVTAPPPAGLLYAAGAPYSVRPATEETDDGAAADGASRSFGSATTARAAETPAQASTPHWADAVRAAEAAQMDQPGTASANTTHATGAMEPRSMTQASGLDRDGAASAPVSNDDGATVATPDGDTSGPSFAPAARSRRGPASLLQRLQRLDPLACAAAGVVLIALVVLQSQLGGLAALGWEAMAASAAALGTASLGLAVLLGREEKEAAIDADPRAPMAMMFMALAAEIARLKRDGTQASQALATAQDSARQLREAAAAATESLGDSAARTACVADALGLLPSIVNRQAARIDAMSDRAERALAQPETAARLTTQSVDALAARFGALPQDVATLLLDRLAGRDAGGDAKLEATIARLEAARPDPALSLGVITATERLEALVATLQQAGHAPAAPVVAAEPSTRTATTALKAQLAALTQASVEGMDQRLTRLVENVPVTLKARLANVSQKAILGIEARVEAQLEALPARLAPLLEASVQEAVAAAIAGLTQAEARTNQATAGLVSELASLAAVVPTLEQAAGRVAGAAERLPELPRVRRVS